MLMQLRFFIEQVEYFQYFRACWCKFLRSDTPGLRNSVWTPFLHESKQILLEAVEVIRSWRSKIQEVAQHFLEHLLFDNFWEYLHEDAYEGVRDAVDDQILKHYIGQALQLHFAFAYEVCLFYLNCLVVQQNGHPIHNWTIQTDVVVWVINHHHVLRQLFYGFDQDLHLKVLVVLTAVVHTNQLREGT